MSEIKDAYPSTVVVHKDSSSYVKYGYGTYGSAIVDQSQLKVWIAPYPWKYRIQLAWRILTKGKI